MRMEVLMSQSLASPILDALRPRDRAHLLDRAVHRRLVAGERLYLAGDRGRRAHLVCSGVVKMTAHDTEGRETILCLGLPGDIIGDVAALDGYPQPLDAVAAMRTTALGFDADLFVAILETNPSACLELARALVQRVRWITDTALERTSSEVPARLAGRLLDLADLIGRVNNGAVELDVPLAQADLGRLAGMCRESANRALKSFKEAGVVDYRGRRLRILRPDALERIRCEGRDRTLRARTRR
jgi:CRP/FNR family cyclic AMP-dependent transcriptional regulator